MRVPNRTRRRTAALLLSLVVGCGAGAAWAATPTDPGWAQQWAPARIGAPAAWDTSRGSGITIGIVDTGVDLGHEDLAGKVMASTSCRGTSGDAAKCAGDGQDGDGHGTHVAGIAAASTDNAKGIAGVAPDAKLLVARVLYPQTGGPPSGTVGDVNAGIKWVVDRGAKVVNLSLGGNFLLTATVGTNLTAGIDYAWSRGAVVVLASGNTQALGFGSSEYGNLNAIVVAATGPDDEVASYSSPTGTAKWAIAAPGGNGGNTNPKYEGKPESATQILSTYLGGQYAIMEGTSMSAAHVAGAVALVMARPGVNASQAVDIVLRTANKAVGCGSNSPHCAGRVDVGAAVAATGNGGAPTTTTTAPRPTTSTTVEPQRPPSSPTSGPTTTVALAAAVTSVPGEISVPAEPEAATTTSPKVPLASGPDGAGSGGAGGLALVGIASLAASAGWAGLLMRRRQLGELPALPFGLRDDEGP